MNIGKFFVSAPAFFWTCTAADLRVESACREAALSEECRRVKFVEYGGLIGRTGGGMAGSFYGSQVCLAIGLTPPVVWYAQLLRLAPVHMAECKSEMQVVKKWEDFSMS